MDLKPGFKQTEIGVIPEDWEVNSLGRLCEISAGRDLVKESFSSLSDERYRYPIYSNALTNKGLYGYSRNHQYEPNKITVTARGDVGHAIYRNTRFCAIGRVLVLSSKYPCDLRFVTEYINNYVDFALESTGVPQLTAPQISNYEIALPPTKAEQEAIAEALSDADALIESLGQLIDKKRQIKQGAMQELLTGKKRLPGFSGEWSKVRMREVLLQPATYGIVTAGAFIQNGIKMLRGGDIVDGRVNTELPMVSHEKATEYSRTTLAKDDVVIALVGYPGASAQIPNELIGANISRAVGLLRLNKKIAPAYLVCFLNSPIGRRMVLAPSAGSAQQVVNLTALNKLEFLLPELDEQTAIAEILSDIDTEIVALETKLSKARHIKQGMMQELLTGRIRIVWAL
jgi:type I restriction enzyme S subunit